MPNIVVVGCGVWGKNHVRCFNELGSLFGIYDTNVLTGARICEEYRNLIFYDNFDSVCRDSRVDGLVIATPAESHTDLAWKALRSGKDVLVEKPIALSAADADLLVETAERHRRVFASGHILEYHPAIRKLRELLPEIGNVREIYSHRLATGKMRKVENVWWSFAPHDVLLILNTLQQKPADIGCVMSDYLNRGVADSTITTFQFPSGCFGHIYVSWTHPFKVHSFVVIGTNGAIEFTDSRKENKLVRYNHKLNNGSNGAEISKGDAEVILFESAEPLMEECRDFVDCIETRGRPRASGEDGAVVVKILSEAMQIARRMNGSPAGSSIKI